MTMHLHHPALSLNGKKKGRQKFRSSAEAQRARELEESWKELQKRWGVEKEERQKKRAMAAPTWTDPTPAYRGQNDPKPQSLKTWHKGAVASKPVQQYTGNKMIGITVIHKSCLQPVFNQQEAIDAAKMRR